MPTAVDSRRDVLIEKNRRYQRRCFEWFFRCNPPGPNRRNYKYGRHTITMLRELDDVTKRIERGLSTYLIINIPPQHGKSDVSSRRWPVWHLGRNPDHRVMMLANNDSLAIEFSTSARNCFKDAADDVFDVQLDAQSAAKKAWRINEHSGVFHAAGINGDVVGHGAEVIIIDDYIADREQAESATQRDKLWHKLSDDIMTRRGNPCAVVIPVTRWHEDDICGRIMQRNDPDHPKYNADFPVFKVILFPAWDDKDGWLFAEKFGEAHYKQARAAQSGMGNYGWNAEYQQDPTPREGSLLHAERTQFLEPAEFNALVESVGVQMVWGWDMASTTKDVSGSDPDFSVGTLAGARDGKVYVARVVAGHWRGATRDKLIRECALSTPNSPVIIESVGAYKEAYEHVRDLLFGQIPVRKFTPVADKFARAQCLEAPFEVGMVYACKADWNVPWVAEHTAFPNGTHDDRVDSLVVAVHDALRYRGALVSR